MSLQQRIDYLTAMSDALVDQLKELIALQQQLKKARMSLGAGRVTGPTKVAGRPTKVAAEDNVAS
jgi:uncharacterized protein YlxW (UPF0749 family)